MSMQIVPSDAHYGGNLGQLVILYMVLVPFLSVHGPKSVKIANLDTDNLQSSTYLLSWNQLYRLIESSRAKMVRYWTQFIAQKDSGKQIS